MAMIVSDNEMLFVLTSQYQGTAHIKISNDDGDFYHFKVQKSEIKFHDLVCK